ncbi:hypothetical protein Q5H89_07130 [Hymenobacter sp. CA2-7]|nr:hypothetical protein [Hymenobacter sp. CA2-7]
MKLVRHAELAEASCQSAQGYYSLRNLPRCFGKLSMTDVPLVLHKKALATRVARAFFMQLTLAA